MNFKKSLSCIIAVAMILSVMAVMTLSVGASYRAHGYDMRAGGFIVNDFRRNDTFLNEVSIYTYGVEQQHLDGVANFHMVLPEGITYEDVKFVRVEFDLPASVDMELMSVFSVVTQGTPGWLQHQLHIDPATEGATCQTSARRVCDNVCAFDMSGDKPVAVIPLNLPEANEFLKIILINSWTEEDEIVGSARVTFLNAQRNLIRATVFCNTCEAGYCSCPCDTCKENPCVCCNRCGNAPDACDCEDPCDECGELTCKCCSACETFPCECACGICNTVGCPGGCGTTPTDPNNSTPPTNNTTPGTGTGTGANNSGGGDDVNPPSGVVLAIIPTLLAGVAVVIARKRK
jgi:hypothetical protein